MLAYLLSVYGTPEFYDGAKPASLFAEPAAESLIPARLARIFDSLPLPSAALNVVSYLFNGVQTQTSLMAPVPKLPIVSVMEPAALKKAIVKLATPDVLSDMAGTGE